MKTFIVFLVFLVSLAVLGCSSTYVKSRVEITKPDSVKEVRIEYAEKERVPEVVVYQYNYASKPPAHREGVIPSDMSAPEPINYPTVHQSTWDDPTLVVLVNESERASLRVSIDDSVQIKLGPQESSVNLHLDIGEHQMRVVALINTSLGLRQPRETIQKIRIDARGRSQIISLRE